MLSKAQIKLIKSLHNKKFRDETGMFIAEGKKLVEDIAASSIKIEHIYATPRYNGSLNHIDITEDELSQISALTSPQSIIALCRIPEVTGVLPDLKNNMALALDDIRDPGNLGTIIRIADWFGINHIFCSNESVEAYNPKTVQATMGSIARVNLYYVDLEEILLRYKNEGLPVYGAMLRGNNVYNESLGNNGILVIGNEANGISESVARCITNPISIPSYAQKEGPESLNAAVAAAVLCAEFKRR
ncbi:MAG TPA: RNA methyltransferase [Bacteroidia bacterium]|jgi:TrmH family RNA methyltransferase|nr:RNA methyltransferase [Bacteroidia bacterium]